LEDAALNRGVVYAWELHYELLDHAEVDHLDGRRGGGGVAALAAALGFFLASSDGRLSHICEEMTRSMGQGYW